MVTPKNKNTMSGGALSATLHIICLIRFLSIYIVFFYIFYFTNYFSFRINTQGVSATEGTDYVWSRQEITINPSDGSTYVASIPINNDQIVEGDETFVVVIDALYPLVTNDGRTLQVTIQDDDSKLKTIVLHFVEQQRLQTLNVPLLYLFAWIG